MKPWDDLVDQRMCDRTMINWDDAVRSFLVIANSSLLPLQLNPGPVTISKGGGDQRDRWNRMQSPQSLDRLFQDFFLESDLCCMIDMLPLAATAVTKIRARRGYPRRGGGGGLIQHA